jgi:hypothetical protein
VHFINAAATTNATVAYWQAPLNILMLHEVARDDTRGSRYNDVNPSFPFSGAQMGRIN